MAGLVGFPKVKTPVLFSDQRTSLSRPSEAGAVVVEGCLLSVLPLPWVWPKSGSPCCLLGVGLRTPPLLPRNRHWLRRGEAVRTGTDASGHRTLGEV